MYKCKKILLNIDDDSNKDILLKLKGSILEANDILTTEDAIKYITVNVMFTPINMDKENGLLKKRVIVAHGAGTEKRFLRAFPMHGFDPWIDTLQLAKKIIPSCSDYSLGALINEHCSHEELKELCPNLTWHDALFDAVANLILLKRLLFMVKGKLSYQEILKF